METESVPPGGARKLESCEDRRKECGVAKLFPLPKSLLGCLLSEIVAPFESLCPYIPRRSTVSSRTEDIPTAAGGGGAWGGRGSRVKGWGSADWPSQNSHREAQHRHRASDVPRLPAVPVGAGLIRAMSLHGMCMSRPCVTPLKLIKYSLSAVIKK